MSKKESKSCTVKINCCKLPYSTHNAWISGPYAIAFIRVFVLISSLWTAMKTLLWSLCLMLSPSWGGDPLALRHTTCPTGKPVWLKNSTHTLPGHKNGHHLDLTKRTHKSPLLHNYCINQYVSAGREDFMQQSDSPIINERIWLNK